MKIEYKGIEFDCEFDYEHAEPEVGLTGGYTLTNVTLAWENTNLIDVLSEDAIQYMEEYAEGRY